MNRRGDAPSLFNCPSDMKNMPKQSELMRLRQRPFPPHSSPPSPLNSARLSVLVATAASPLFSHGNLSALPRDRKADRRDKTRQDKQPLCVSSGQIGCNALDNFVFFFSTFCMSCPLLCLEFCCVCVFEYNPRRVCISLYDDR